MNWQPKMSDNNLIENVPSKVYQLWLGDELIEFPYEEIKADPELEKHLKHLERRKAECEIQFYKPHGNAKFGHDCGFDLASATDWINDDEHTMAINFSPNQVGKTCMAVVKKVLKIIPCNPKWPIFVKNGVKFRDWEGAKTLVVLGYDKGQLMDVLWPELQKWIPMRELGNMCPTVLGGTRGPCWERHPRVQLRCGSRIIFLTYNQDASSCAGIKATEILADEQPPLTFFSELDQRGRTLGGVYWTFSATPHKVEGRPDTGVNSWLYEVWTGRNTRGHNVIRTRITVDEVPDRIYSPEEKQKSYLQNVVMPQKTGNARDIAEGKARYYGIAQPSSGLFYGEIDPEIHFINWDYDSIKEKGWTHYRSMDYGVSNPTACVMAAVSPSGEIFIYDEYYVAGKDAIEHGPAIIAKCGNERKLVRQIKDKNNDTPYDVYEEIVKRQRYVRTWLDWHCFQNFGGSGRPISFFFQISGLKVVESSKLKQDARAQNLRALLRIDKNRNHLVTGKPGAPRIYVSLKCQKLKWEWEHCVYDTRAYGDETHNPKEVKQSKNDHLIDAVEYLASATPRYLGDFSQESNASEPLHKNSGY